MIKHIKLMLIVVSLLLTKQAIADVTQNVTFTVKNNGTVIASSDIGSFDAQGKILTVSSVQMPSEFRTGVGVGNVSSDQFVLTTPVGYNIKSLNDNYGHKLDMSFRLQFLNAASAGSFSLFRGSCDGFVSGDSVNGIRKINTDGKPFSYTGCSSIETRSGGGLEMQINELKFAFMESTGGANSLSNLKLPAGRYEFAPQLFNIRHSLSPMPSVSKNWYVKVTVIIEPSIGAVNMPTAMPLDVTTQANNIISAKGSVLATVTGTLGKNLKILPSSSNNGYLVKGTEKIPYLLSVTPLSGDNKSRTLIDGNAGGAQAEAIINTNEQLFQYQLRFDAGFNTPASSLSSGRFNDNVTLIFSTSDMP